MKKLKLDGIEVEEECPLCMMGIMRNGESCGCNGGKIHRPAKLEDIDLKRLITGYEIMADEGYLQTVKEAIFIAKDFLKIPSGGRLVIKKGK